MNKSNDSQTLKNNKRPQGGGPMGGMRQGSGDKAKDFFGSILKLVRYLKPYWWIVALSLVFIITATILSIIAPSYIAIITDAIQASLPTMERPYPIPIDMDVITKAAIVLIIFYGLSFILNYLQAFLMAHVNQGVSKSLRKSISKKINQVPMNYYDKISYGDILSRVTNDVDTIGQTLNQSITTLISSVVMLVGVLIAMFIVNWIMALVAIATVPLSMIFMMIIIKISQKYFMGQQKKLGELNGHIEETYTGLNVVKAFNAEDKRQESFDDINSTLYTNERKSQFLSGLMMPIMSFVSNLSYVAIAVVGAILFVSVKHNITAGVITSFFIYVNLFQNPLSQIAQAANSLQSTAAASERVFEFLAEPEQTNEDSKQKMLETVKGKVEFKNVRFGYVPEKTIINNFSAKIEPGQKVAIVGPTGAGKTTMVNLLMRFYELNAGEILIDNVPISEMKREEVRSLFSMVLQDTWLFEGTIRENIVYSKTDATEEEVINACIAANVDHFIRTLPNGYNMMLDDQSNISSGQRQLLTIARAMIQNSPMLILDEATSNVDTRTEQLIQDAMDKLTIGRTSFVIAHRLSTIKNSDLILVMKDGDIIESGNHEALLKQNGFYAELYNSQFSHQEEIEE